MKFYKNHSAIWEKFVNADIHSIIAPYGFSIPYQKFEFNYPCRIICQPDQKVLCNLKNIEVRTIPKIHAKLAIGFKGVLFGSFNFRESHQKELMAYFDSPQEIEEALCEFDYWWNIAKPVKP